MVFKKTHLADSLTTTAIRIYPTKIFATHPSQKSVGHLRNSQKKSLFHIQLDSYPFVRSVLVLDNDLKGSLINYSRRLYPVFCQKCIFFLFQHLVLSFHRNRCILGVFFTPIPIQGVPMEKTKRRKTKQFSLEFLFSVPRTKITMRVVFVTIDNILMITIKNNCN